VNENDTAPPRSNSIDSGEEMNRSAVDLYSWHV
jgi:hypothetical protein